ncbi:hypothetical protein ACI79C_13160 [Geodermatophilus sp. SYSU D00697]
MVVEQVVGEPEPQDEVDTRVYLLAMEDALLGPVNALRQDAASSLHHAVGGPVQGDVVTASGAVPWIRSVQTDLDALQRRLQRLDVEGRPART